MSADLLCLCFTNDLTFLDGRPRFPSTAHKTVGVCTNARAVTGIVAIRDVIGGGTTGTSTERIFISCDPYVNA